MIVKDVLYDGANKLDAFVPDGEVYDTVVYFHGGGLESGSKEVTHDLAAQFCGRGYCFVTADYPMYPEAKFPEYIEACARAVKYSADNFRCKKGGKLYVGGSSAGAYLTLMLCMDGKYLSSVGMSRDGVDGWISDSAQPFSHYNVIKYESGEDQRRQLIDKYAPIYYLDAKTSFTRLLVIYYENDIACRPEQNVLFVRAIKNFDPEADVSSVMLKGGHCAGVVVKDKDGVYPLVSAVTAWIGK